MLSDKVNLLGMGHRKPYMMLGLLLAALAFGGATLALPDANFTLFAVLIMLGSFSVTLFDSTTDGLAADDGHRRLNVRHHDGHLQPGVGSRRRPCHRPQRRPGLLGGLLAAGSGQPRDAAGVVAAVQESAGDCEPGGIGML